MLGSIDRHLSLDEVRQELKPFYSSTGRPSIDPELIIRMLIVGYCMGIRSERRLCEEVHLNLAYRWFCRLGLDGKVPVHSTFSKNRHGRFRESNVLRHLFETVVERCMAEGLVGADGFAVDASLIAADANKQRSVPSDEWKPEEVKDKACRAAREYLATLDDAAFGAASPVTPKFISPSDPAAQWTGAHKGHAFFAYAFSRPHSRTVRPSVRLPCSSTPKSLSHEIEQFHGRCYVAETAAKINATPFRLRSSAPDPWNDCFWRIPEMPPAAIDGRLWCPIGLWQDAQRYA